MITGTSPLITLESASRCLGIPLDTLKSAAGRERLRTVKLAKVRLTTKEWLEDYINNYSHQKDRITYDWSEGEWIDYTGTLMDSRDAADYLGISKEAAGQAGIGEALRGFKVSRYAWVTTLEWVQDYQRARPDGRRVDNTSGYSGVHRKRADWGANIKEDGKHYHLGTFSTNIEAAQVRAYAELHGVEACLKKYPLKKRGKSEKQSSYRGVSWRKGGQSWRADIWVNNKSYYLGCSHSEEGAYQKRLEGERRVADGTFDAWFTERQQRRVQ